MSPRTGLDSPDDVVARLREAAHAVPDVRFDTPAVLASARRALRRRRRRQAVVGVVGAGLVALTVAGPVHLPGVGTFAMPGGHQVRVGLGVEDPDAPAPAAGFDLGELREWLAQFSSEPPSPETMAEDVAGLREHVLPVLEDVRPTWYEANQGCDVLEYPRGTFSDDGDVRRAPRRAAVRRARAHRPRPAGRRRPGQRRAVRGAPQRVVHPGRHCCIRVDRAYRWRDRVELLLPVLPRGAPTRVGERPGACHDHPDRRLGVVLRAGAQRLS